MAQLRGKIAEARKLSAGMGDAASAATVLDLLKELSGLAPADLLLTSFTLDGDVIGLKGEVRNFDAVDTVKKTFANSKYFKTVTIGSTNMMKQGSGVEFDLKMTVEKMRRFWDQLTKSQKLTVTAGLVFVGAALLVQFAVVPYFDARQKVRSAIAASEKALRELAVLGAEYGVLRQRSEEIRRVIERRPPGFALFSYLEKRAGDAGVKTNIRSINPLKSGSDGGLRGDRRGDEAGQADDEAVDRFSLPGGIAGGDDPDPEDLHRQDEGEPGIPERADPGVHLSAAASRESLT